MSYAAAKARARAAERPIGAHLELTYACNWRCVFCYNPRHADLRPLDVPEWCAVLDDLRDLGALTVTLSGGEPLAHPRFFDIAGAVRARRMAVRVFTNGALVDDAAAREIARLRPLGVELSLHGATSVTHDRTTRRPGSFDALLAALSRLRAERVPLLLKTPVTRWNEDELEGIVQLAQELDVPLRLDPDIKPRDDGGRGPLRFAPTREGALRALRMLRRVGRLPIVQRTPGGTNCGLGSLTVAVDPEGNVFPCLQWRTSSLGNVRDASLRALWDGSPVRREAVDAAKAANDALVALGGAAATSPFCPARARAETGSATTPDPTFRERVHLLVAAADEA